MTERKYKGKKPRTEGWEQIAAIEDEVRWLVFVKDNPDSEWMTVKVVADGRAQGKANYWLGWNGKHFANFKDMLALVQHRPELLREVGRLIAGYDLL